MRRILWTTLLLAWLGAVLPPLKVAAKMAQNKPEQDFFVEEKEMAGPEVRTFALPLAGGNWTMNCYVAWHAGSKQALVIDPGAPPSQVLEFIRAKGLKVLAILNTHGHYDHVGGVASLAAKLPVPCYLHRADHALAENTTGKDLKFTDYPADGRLALGELAIDVIHTPGHSPGSVCLKIGNILFSGDTLFAGGIGKAYGDGRGQRQANLRLEIDNIRTMLLPLPSLTRVFPGHGQSTTISAERAFNSFLK